MSGICNGPTCNAPLGEHVHGLTRYCSNACRQRAARHRKALEADKLALRAARVVEGLTSDR